MTALPVDLEARRERRTRVELVVDVAVRVAAQACGLDTSVLRGHAKTRSHVDARFLAWWLAHRVGGISLPKLAACWGMDHTSVLYGVRKVDGRRTADPEYRRWVEDRTTRFGVAVGQAEAEPLPGPLVVAAMEALVPFVPDVVDRRRAGEAVMERTAGVMAGWAAGALLAGLLPPAEGSGGVAGLGEGPVRTPRATPQESGR